MTVEWKPIRDYEQLYEISNCGDVRSIGYYLTKGIRVLKKCIDRYGYILYGLRKDGKTKTFRAHRLVWEHFGNSQRDGVRLQIDHIDNDKINNRIDNLQLLSGRQNMAKLMATKRSNKKEKLPLGVHHYNKNYSARVFLKGKRVYLGTFKTIEEASQVYENALNNYKPIEVI